MRVPSPAGMAVRLSALLLFLVLCMTSLPATALPPAVEPEPHEEPDATPLYPELAAQAPALSARAAILMDAASGMVLYAKNATEQRPPASTTKVMSALLAYEFGDMNDIVTISRNAARTGGSRMGVREGERYTLADLVYGMLLPSGNDAAVAVAEHLSGSVEHFTKLMNLRAQQLGMHATTFTNPHGLPDPRHVTTALDLARLTRAALQHDAFLAMACARWHDVCTVDQTRQYRIASTNRLLWSFPYTEGGKTGTTSAAGRCLITVAAKGGRRLIAVVLNAPDRWRDSIALLEWGFDAFATLRLGRAGDRITHVPTTAAPDGVLPLALEETLFAVVPQHEPLPLTMRLTVTEAPQPPLPAGRVLGHVTVLYGGRPIAEQRLVAAISIDRPRFWQQLAERLHLEQLATQRFKQWPYRL